MKLSIFQLKPRPKDLEKLLTQFPFDPNHDLSEEERQDPEKMKKAEADHRAYLEKERWINPAFSEIEAICFLDEDGRMQALTGTEHEVITKFWDIADKQGRRFAGWDIFDRDMQWLKVRSWYNKIKIPARSFQPAEGSPRESWHGFVDIRREFMGGPKSSLECVTGASFDKIAKAFGYAGAFSKDTDFQAALSSNDREKVDLELGHLEKDLKQMLAIADRIGLNDIQRQDELSPSERMRLERFSRSNRDAQDPINLFDIETRPGNLEDLKRIEGEFDPKKVSMGNLKDPVKKEAKIALARANYDNKILKSSLLDPCLGSVLAIGYIKPGEAPEIPEQAERELLVDFWDRYAKNPGKTGGWNNFGFDNDYIKIRSWILGVTIPKGLITRAGNGYSKWKGMVDLMIVYNGRTREYAGLGLVAEAFNHPGKNGDGALFYKDFLSDDPAKKAKAVEYLKGDLFRTCETATDLGYSPPEVAPPSLTDRMKEDCIPGLE